MLRKTRQVTESERSARQMPMAPLNTHFFQGLHYLFIHSLLRGRIPA